MNLYPPENAMTSQIVTRISMPYDEIGVLTTNQLDAEHTLTKRKRKALVANITRMIKLGGLVPSAATVISVGKVIDCLGQLQFEAIYITKESS